MAKTIAGMKFKNVSYKLSPTIINREQYRIIGNITHLTFSCIISAVATRRIPNNWMYPDVEKSRVSLSSNMPLNIYVNVPNVVR